MPDSPVVLSQYDPKGKYLAYVSVALDKHRIAVEPTSSSKAAAATNDNFLYLDDSQLRVTTLQWLYLASEESQVVALGLSNGEIWLYAPAANQVVYKLRTGSSHAIRDFQSAGKTAWCCDQSDTLYQFSMLDFSIVTKFKLESCVNLHKLCIVGENRLLVASHSISLLDLSEKEVIRTFPGHVSPVSTLEMLTSNYFVSGAVNDRFLNVYDIETGTTKSVLVSQSNILHVSHYKEQAVVVSTEDGTFEIFPDALVNTSNKRRNVLSKQAAHLVKVVRPKSEESVPVLNVFINATTVNYAWLENAVIPYFDQLQWQTLPPTQVIEKARPIASSKSAHRSLYGEDIAASKSYVEGNATVTSGDNFKYVHQAIAEVERNEEDAEESLADKLASTDITTKLAESRRAKKRSTTGTLTVVLTQALQSNDHSLLETVLNNRDERVIKGTISRLQPPLAVILLERLAERIARQTNRQGPLNVWVKWCLIIHGGYLAGMPNLIASLSSLHSTLKMRCDLLPRLLVLESKLDHTLNRLDCLRTIDSSMQESLMGLDPAEAEELEEEVEYIEELDDAGLIDDGELDYDDSDESEGSDEESEAKLANGYSEENFDDDPEMRVEVEEGYSDVEVE
ncbi:LAFE_0F15874g1_1 [Lachancea fermentati]|uniref:LAFE_0F15874g1_1 n=1 Tax=Lachancea fermentati TaxID=4955 RepID=A0A1G4MG98_LACFM|nr:LAFE_0F15874g1_1 [Lachancea fermentati]